METGTNHVLGLRPERIAEVPELLKQATAAPARVPEGWDGFAADRLVDLLASIQLEQLSPCSRPPGRGDLSAR